MSGRPINALELYSRFRNEMNKPDPFRANEVPVDRGFIAPLATYADGQTELAWPSFPVGAVIDGVRSFGAKGFDTPEAIQHNAGAAFDTAGGIVQGGLGVGLAGGLADNAVKAVVKPALEDMPARAAFKWGDDVFTGQYHGNAIRAAVDKYGKDPINAAWDPDKTFGWGDLEGFKTIGGDFVTRDQALDTIRASGLAKNEWLPDTELHADTLNYLRSKGLWANAPTGSSVPLALNALERAQPQGIRAYHGSPHDFDRFSLDAIGTGEGAQAYGHGLYFADSEDVARSYRDALSRPQKGVNLGAVPISSEAGKLALMSSGGDIDKAIASVDGIVRGGGKHAEMYQGVLDELIANRDGIATAATSPGRMYEVNIRANPEDFLDWDKPLSQQSERVQNVLNKLLENDYISPDLPIGPLVQKELKNPDTISNYMRDAGVAGVRYYDQSSRGPGNFRMIRPEESVSGKWVVGYAPNGPNNFFDTEEAAKAFMAAEDAKKTRNYAVFDDQLIDILRKYANAPTASAVPLAGETQDTELALEQYLRMIGL